jgi:DNA-binding transcriptional LysR family regulator
MSVMSEPMINAKVPGIVFRKVEGVSRKFELALVYRRNEAAPAVKTFIEFIRRRAKPAET